jgi:UDP-2,3-diacylglucosamine hydrolase
MSHLFISDLHLEEGREDIRQAFLEFLRRRAPAADSLYILGDFFEVWLGDDHSSALSDEVIGALAGLDLPKYLMHGNRDFLLGAGFCEATGMTLLADPTVINLHGRPILLMHGDSLCTLDEEYMAARKLLRDPAFQADFLSKPIAERAAFARAAREKSKAHTLESAAEIMDVTPEEVPKVMAGHGVTLMIHGHTHRPKVHDLEVDGMPAQRIVLGDWDKLGWYLEVDEDGYRLESFSIAASD